MRALFLVILFSLVSSAARGQVGLHFKHLTHTPSFQYSILNSKGYLQSIHEVIQGVGGHKLTKVLTYSLDSLCTSKELFLPNNLVPGILDDMNNNPALVHLLDTDNKFMYYEENSDLFHAVIHHRDCRDGFAYSYLVVRLFKLRENEPD